MGLCIVLTVKSPYRSIDKHTITESIMDLCYKEKKPLCNQDSYRKDIHYCEKLSGVESVVSNMLLENGR